MKLKPFLQALSLLTLYGCSEGLPTDAKLEDALISEQDSISGSFYEQRNFDAHNVTIPPAQLNQNWVALEPNAQNYVSHYKWGGKFENLYSYSVGSGGWWSIKNSTSPVVANDRLYTLDTAGTVRAANLTTGEELWSYTIEDANDGGGLTVDAKTNQVFVTPSKKGVYAFNSNGTLMWNAATDTIIRGALHVHDGVVYTVSHDNVVLAFDQKTGKQLSKYEGVEEDLLLWGNGRLAVEGKHKVLGLPSGDIVNFGENAKPRWVKTVTPSMSKDIFSSIVHNYASPVIHQGRVYSSSFSGELSAYNLLNGARIWKAPTSSLHAPAMGKTHLFNITPTGSVEAINLQSGKLRWHLDIGEVVRNWKPASYDPAELKWHRPLLANGKLLVMNDMGHVFIINPHTGHVEEEKELPVRVAANPIIVNGKLIVLSLRGSVYVYE